MRKTSSLFLLLIFTLVLAACGPTGDTSSDANAAQSLLPNINGYTVAEGNSLITAITTAGAGAALTSGNVPLAAAINRAEVVTQCLAERGAVAVSTYVETRPANIVPEAGAVIVLNTSRVTSNLASCIAESAGFSAQAVLDWCANTGNFTYNNDQYTYLYVGAGTNVCGFFQQHFEALGATTS